jgi:hypothetical protein
MKQFVFVINGSGGVGKDTLCNLAAKHYRVRNISSITPIKHIAGICGWNGEKSDRARKFLADLKSLTAAYNDYPTNWIYEEYCRFKEGDEEILFVHIREGSEIKKFVEKTGGDAITLLIRGGKRFHRRKPNYGNAADDDVENYRYDYVFYNDRPLDQTEAAFVAFIDRIRRERG